MSVVGKLTTGENAYPLTADTKRVARFTVPQDCYVSKLTAYMDGKGGGIEGGSGGQVVRAVIYRASGALVAEGEEIEIAHDAEAAWVDLPLQEDGFAITAGVYDFGVHAGQITNTIRIYGDDPGLRGGRTAADVYEDGASDPFGSTVVTADISIFLTYAGAWVPPLAPDSFYARLPFTEAQQIFGADTPLGTTYRVRTGWFGTRTYDHRGSVALVKTGGVLDRLVGERIGVRRRDKRGKQVAVYVAGRSSVIGYDLSLSRQAFGALGLLSEDFFDVSVQILAPPEMGQ